MAELFERTSINGMSLANRFVWSATWEGLADEDGAVTTRLIDMMVELARGEVGLIISSHAFVSPEGRATPRSPSISAFPSVLAAAGTAHFPDTRCRLTKAPLPNLYML